MTQVVELLQSKCEALCSAPRTQNKTKNHIKACEAKMDKTARKKIVKFSVIIGDFNTSLQKQIQQAEHQYRIELHITDICSLLHPTTEEYILFTLTWNIHQDRPHSQQ
jgi:redox-sensitive bicupin YhaK (pirin superfamily)